MSRWLSTFGGKTDRNSINVWLSGNIDQAYRWFKSDGSNHAYTAVSNDAESQVQKDVEMRRMSFADDSAAEKEGRLWSDDNVSPDVKSASTSTPPLSKFQFWMVFGSVLLGLFIACFDMTLMASSHPVITSYFHSSTTASWLSTSFLLTTTAFQPLFGRMSDTFGRRPLLILTLAIFTFTTLWCALAPTIGSFIAARAFTGLGAGGTMAMAAIVTNDVVPLEVRAAYQSMINLAFGLGAACGAAFGGVLCEYLGWRWTFGVQVPFILATLVAGAVYTPRTLGPQLAVQDNKGFVATLRDFDLAGSLSLSVTAALLILALNSGGNVLPWTHPLVVSCMGLSILTGMLTLRLEARHPRPVMPLNLLFSKPRGNMIFANFFAHIGFNTILFNAPLFFQVVHADSPASSGFRLTFPALATCVFGISSGLYIAASGRISNPLFLGVGSMILGGFGVVLSSSVVGLPAWVLVLGILPASIGQGLNFPATTMGLLAVSSTAEQAVVSATLTLWRDLGIVVGVGGSSALLQNMLRSGLEGRGLPVEIVAEVRESVRAVLELAPAKRAEVVAVYRHSLTLTFCLAIAAFVVVLLLTLPVKLPVLKKKGTGAQTKGPRG